MPVIPSKSSIDMTIDIFAVVYLIVGFVEFIVIVFCADSLQGVRVPRAAKLALLVLWFGVILGRLLLTHFLSFCMAWRSTRIASTLLRIKMSVQGSAQEHELFSSVQSCKFKSLNNF